MKFGYRCQCGWVLSRMGNKRRLTRTEYSLRKQLHAAGHLTGQAGPCEHLTKELKRTLVSS